jgi:hypothetical protein
VIPVLIRGSPSQSTVAQCLVDMCIVSITRLAPGVHQPDPPGLIHDDLRLLPPWRGSSLFVGHSTFIDGPSGSFAAPFRLAQ